MGAGGGRPRRAARLIDVERLGRAARLIEGAARLQDSRIR
jgi:hypothetical protein